MTNDTTEQLELPAAARWCVLRVQSARTLKLATSLAEAGFDCWTPSIMVKRRLPRKPGHVSGAAPLLPTFVFARAHHCADLLAMTRADTCKHLAFSVFRFAGEIVFIREREIDKLRLLELRMTPKRRRPTVAVGTEVCPTSGAYAGLTGTVTKSDGKLTLIAFGGWMNVQIETSTLIDSGVKGEHSSMSLAA